MLALAVLVLVVLGEISCLDASTCRYQAGYDITLGCVPALAPGVGANGLRTLTHCQCNWDTDINYNAGHTCNDLNPCTAYSATGTPVTVASTVAETTLNTTSTSYTPAQGRSFRITSGGIRQMTSGKQLTYRVYLGSTNILSYTFTGNGALTNEFWFMDLMCTVRTATSTYCTGSIGSQNDSGTTVVDAVNGVTLSAWSGVVKTTVQPSNNSANDLLTQHTFVVEPVL